MCCINVGYIEFYYSVGALWSSHVQASLVYVSIHCYKNTFMGNQGWNVIFALPEMSLLLILIL